MTLILDALLSNIRLILARYVWYAMNRCAGVNWAFHPVVCGLTGTPLKDIKIEIIRLTDTYYILKLYIKS